MSNYEIKQQIESLEKQILYCQGQLSYPIEEWVKKEYNEVISGCEIEIARFKEILSFRS